MTNILYSNYYVLNHMCVTILFSTAILLKGDIYIKYTILLSGNIHFEY